MRVRPEVQGAAVFLETKRLVSRDERRVLASPGPTNRVTQAISQPGCTIKPLSYLAALGKGVQPNTLVMDTALTLPPIGSDRAGEGNYWRPKNYDGRSGGVLTLRRALEKSRNLATVRLLGGGIEKKPEDSLNRLCDLAVEAQIYRECLRLYPFVLGAQPVRPIDLAAFYAAIANEGLRPTPHGVESIERDGEVIYRHQQMASPISRSTNPRSINSRGCCRAWWPAGRPVGSRTWPPMWLAKLAPLTTKTMLGLWVSRTRSRSLSGSDTTMPMGSAARSVPVQPGAPWLFQFLSRSSRRCGPMRQGKWNLLLHQRTPRANSRANRPVAAERF